MFFKKKETSDSNRDGESNTQNSWQAAVDHSRKMTYLLGFSLVIIAALTFQVLKTDTITIVTPYKFSEPLKFINNKGQSSYKAQWGNFVAEMLGNVSNRNLHIVLDNLKPMVSIQDYDTLEEQLKAHVKALEIRNQIQTFDIIDTFYDNKHDNVIVYGERKLTDKKRASAKDNERRPVRWTYVMTISNEHGQAKLLDIDQYEGAPQIERTRLERDTKK